jgi:hypothetical protein
VLASIAADHLLQAKNEPAGLGLGLDEKVIIFETDGVAFGIGREG